MPVFISVTFVISCAKDEEDLTGSIYGKVTDTQRVKFCMEQL